MKRNMISLFVGMILVLLFASTVKAENVEPAPIPAGFYLANIGISGDYEIEANFSYSRESGVAYFQTYMSYNKYGGNVWFIAYDPISGNGLDEQEYAYLINVIQYGLENALSGGGLSSLPPSLSRSRIADKFINGWIAESSDQSEKLATSSPEKEIGWHILDIGISGDYEIEANWLLVRQDGSVVSFSSYMFWNDKSEIGFIAMYQRNGRLTENEIIFWSEKQIALEMALRSGSVNPLPDNLMLGNGVVKFIESFWYRFRSFR